MAFLKQQKYIGFCSPLPNIWYALFDQGLVEHQTCFGNTHSYCKLYMNYCFDLADSIVSTQCQQLHENNLFEQIGGTLTLLCHCTDFWSYTGACV